MLLLYSEHRALFVQMYFFLAFNHTALFQQMSKQYYLWHISSIIRLWDQMLGGSEPANNQKLAELWNLSNMFFAFNIV